MNAQSSIRPVLNGMERLIFASRWLQAPLYLGLIVAQGVYVYKFVQELEHLVVDVDALGETQIMLIVLGLIDVVMIANLLVMVVVGGYETFVSKIDALQRHTDRPEWLSHVNAGVLKTKLAMALISISSIHLLKTFIGISDGSVEHVPSDYTAVMWQVAIHLTFLLSALVMAYTDRLTHRH